MFIYYYQPLKEHELTKNAQFNNVDNSKRTESIDMIIRMRSINIKFSFKCGTMGKI